MWHYYAEIYYNGRKDDGLYAYGSGVVSTNRKPDEAGWYDELRQKIARELGASSTKPNGVTVMSLTKL
jgi:hypothetical protein